MKTHITLNLEFAGVILPVGKNEQGEDIVPLKPISDVFGLDWKRQYRRMQTPYFSRRLGVCMGHMSHAGQTREMVCVRIDRVMAYLNNLNPESIRAAGNVDGADFLEAKQNEWDDIIHAYEVARGDVFKGTRLADDRTHKKQQLYLATCRAAKQMGNSADVVALKNDLAEELGYAIQQELPTGTAS